MRLHTYENSHETAVAVTRRLIDVLYLHDQPAFHLAISGGNTAKILFDLWRGEFKDLIDWSRIHLYWVDERHVPLTSKESNYGEAKRLFIDHVPIPHSQLFPIDGQADPVTEAKRYSELLMQKIPVREGRPRFDLIILGFGSDGHTASIFPGQEELLTTEAIYAPSVNPESGVKRVTMTAKTIIEAHEVIIHATGQAKSPVLRALLKAVPDPQNAYPVDIIAREIPSVDLYVNEEMVQHVGLDHK